MKQDRTLLRLPEDGTTTASYAYRGQEILVHSKLDISVLLKYKFEPPHGDPLFELYIAGFKESENVYWGRDIAISPDGRYLVITKNLKNIVTTVFDFHSMKKCDVAGLINIVGFEESALLFRSYFYTEQKGYSKSQILEKIILNDSLCWEPLMLTSRCSAHATRAGQFLSRGFMVLLRKSIP